MRYLRWFATGDHRRYAEEVRRHHRRFRRYVEEHGVPCTDCEGQDEECDTCEGTGLMPPTAEAQRTARERTGA